MGGWHKCCRGRPGSRQIPGVRVEIGAHPRTDGSALRASTPECVFIDASVACSLMPASLPWTDENGESIIPGQA